MDDIIDSIIVDCNNSIRTIMTGNYIGWCSDMVLLTRNLELLKNKIQEETENKNKKIEELKSQINSLNEIMEKDGVGDGK